MNETTILEKRPTANGQPEKKNEGVAWKQVTLGGVSGILMGAGLLYAGQISAQELAKEETPEDVTAPDPNETSHTLENGLKVAEVSDDLSFGEAFAQARAEVGPGGVFHWHGGIYNTYTADEWSSMTVEQKHDFAQQVQPEIRPEEIPTPTDAHPDVAVHQAVEATPEQPSQDVEVQVVSQETSETPDADAEVHIIGYGEVQGHVAVGLDTDGDGQADVAIIDVDDSGGLSDPDVLVDDQGNMATYGELNNEPDPNLQASMENPDVAPDMPDYMNDANVDDMNVIA
jgi:hypothetical protein